MNAIDAALRKRPSSKSDTTDLACACGQGLDLGTQRHCPRCGCPVKTGQRS